MGTNKPTWPSRYIDAGKPKLRGGFGEGAILKDTWLDRQVFLKTIHDPSAAAQLAREIAAIATIRSKHVCALYEVLRNGTGQIVGVIYEYVPGSDLSPAMYPVGSDLNDYLKTLYQLIAGIRDIHKAGIVHRDIKLSNVKRDAESILKIFDFGISSDRGDVTHASRGTLFYLAPELFKPPAKITPAIDIYAFGACCWALVTATVPPCLFDRPPQSKSPVPSISTALSKLHPQVANTIDSCLAVNPRDRPTADEVYAVIYRHLIKERHRAIFTGLDAPRELHSGNRGIRMRTETGEVVIEYNGLEFLITNVTGEVFVNNRPAVAGGVLDEACLITFGNPSRQQSRSHVQISASHPEVVL
jgi:eukaryotic-like serine/threonine-protein kinase